MALKGAKEPEIHPRPSSIRKEKISFHPPILPLFFNDYQYKLQKAVARSLGWRVSRIKGKNEQNSPQVRSCICEPSAG